MRSYICVAIQAVTKKYGHIFPITSTTPRWPGGSVFFLVELYFVGYLTSIILYTEQEK